MSHHSNGNFDIVFIEYFLSNSKDKLHAKESHFTKPKDCINKIKKQG